MKRLYMTILSILCAIGIAIAISYAWFINSEMIDPSTSGYSASAYFAYGNGAIADEDHPNNRPYGIRTPRQLYNLAWLVYLDTTGQYRNKYYEIDAAALDDNTLDMSGWVLPPIGTSTSQFLGNFNGQGAIIANLTTSNNFNDFENVTHPSSVSTIQNCNNMGFFGVVGPTNGNASDSNSVYDFYLSNQTVKTETSVSNTYFGVAAGYVNATMEDVGIISATLNNANSTTVSEYSVVGYATTTYLTALNKKSTIIYNPTRTNTTKYTFQGKGSATGWGGSIDMLSMYNTLKTEWNTIVDRGGTGSIQYPYSRTVSYTNTGKISTSDTMTSFATPSSNSTAVPSNYVYTSVSTSGNYIRFYDVSKSITIDGVSYKTSSYSLLIEKPESPASSEWQYMCLTGYANRAVYNGLTISYTYPNAYFLTDGTNYLKLNDNTSVTNVTSTSSAGIWYYDSQGHYWTFESYGSSDQPKLYLVDDGTGTPKLSETASSTWTYSNNTLKSNTNHYLVYDKENSSWKLYNSSTYPKVGGWNIKSGNRYLNRSGTSVASSTTANTVWFVDSSNNIYTYDSTDNSTKYYLYSGNSYNTISVGNSGNYKYTKSGNTIKNSYSSSYYIYLNNTNWSTRTTSTDLTWESATMDFTATVNRTAATSTLAHNETTNAPFSTPNTYFPLQSTDGVPDDKNTGYLVSGANYFNDSYGDIRVSGYKISDSLGNAGYANLTKVYTIDSSKTRQTIVNGSTDNSSNYVRFSSAYKAMKKVLSNSNTQGNIDGKKGYVYGLHFMNATIGLETQSQEVRIPYAKINGDAYYNYQVPYDCIDFNLKDKGYITFFAGTYYTNNKSFFSLYEIYRGAGANSVNIDGIAEITEIYSSTANPDSYVYKLTTSNGTKYSVPFKYKKNTDGTYELDENNRKIKVNLDGTNYVRSFSNLTSNKPSGYTTTIFKTQAIKAQSSLISNACYYFEIPVDDGEYCLGAVPNSNGAYLMYLDIGANATEVYRSEITQKTSITTETQKYPSGVAIVANSSSDIVPRNSAVAKITSAGTHSVSISGTAITISGVSSSSYICPDVTLNNNMVATGTDPTETIIEQLMIVDYVKSDSISTYVTLITDETINSVTSRSSEYAKISGEGVLEGWGLFTTPDNELDALVYTTDHGDFEFSTTGSTEAQIKEKHYYYTTNTATTTNNIKMFVDDGAEQDEGMYYNCGGDNIYITTDETIKVYVNKKEAGLTYNFFFNLDLDNNPYPHTDATPITINNNSSYEYTYTATP